MDRLISEQAVLDEICKSCSVESKPNKCQYRKGLNGGCLEYETVKAIPSAEPKTGKWLGINKNTWCSNCAIGLSEYIKGDFAVDVEDLPPYCPNCGAKMVEPQESEDK